MALSSHAVRDSVAREDANVATVIADWQRRKCHVVATLALVGPISPSTDLAQPLLCKPDMEDSELKERFGKMDAQFAEMRKLVIHEANRTRKRFNVAAERFAERFKDDVSTRFDVAAEKLKDDVGTRFDVAAERLKDDVGIRFDIAAEGLKDEVKLIRDGYAALREDTAEIKDRLGRVETGQERLEVRMLAVETRVSSVEKTQKVVLTEVRGLATKVDRFSRERRRGGTRSG